MSENIDQQHVDQQQEAEHWKAGQKPAHSEWGKASEDHFGYASDEERRNRRGLEDWEMVEKMSVSQKRVPVWFLVVIGIVLLVAFGLSLPFWGDRPDHPRQWFGWGHLIAVAYFIVAGTFIYFMVNLFNPEMPDEDDCDPSKRENDGVE